MSYFPWKPEYSVHVTEIDLQHKKLVELMNDLYNAMREGKGSAFLGEAVDKLARYTLTHFATEERLMQTAVYPGFAAHKLEHDAFVAKVKDFQTQLQNGQMALTVTVSNFLKEWLVKHILDSDMQYSTYLTGKGIH
jgi:hemerythrin